MDACNKVEPLRHGASLGFYSKLGQDKEYSLFSMEGLFGGGA